MEQIHVVDQVPEVQAVQVLDRGVDARNTDGVAIFVVAHAVRSGRLRHVDGGDLKRGRGSGAELANLCQVDHLVRDAALLQPRDPLPDLALLSGEVEHLPALSGDLDNGVDDHARAAVVAGARSFLRVTISTS